MAGIAAQPFDGVEDGGAQAEVVRQGVGELGAGQPLGEHRGDALVGDELLEPGEAAVARLLAQGLTNEQIAARSGFRDKRTISRVNGQIYAAWGLDISATDEKAARTRAALIASRNRLMIWDADGTPRVMNDRGEWVIDA